MHNSFYGGLGRKKGFSHYNGENWINTQYNPEFPVVDMGYVTVDPFTENRVYISSMGVTTNFDSVSTGGITVVENDEITTFYNYKNSSLEDIEPNNTNVIVIRVTDTTFDNQGNLWIASMSFDEEIKKTCNILNENNKNYSLLHCVSIYPTPLKEVHLNRIEFLRELNQKKQENIFLFQTLSWDEIKLYPSVK